VFYIKALFGYIGTATTEGIKRKDENPFRHTLAGCEPTGCKPTPPRRRSPYT